MCVAVGLGVVAAAARGGGSGLCSWVVDTVSILSIHRDLLYVAVCWDLLVSFRAATGLGRWDSDHASKSERAVVVCARKKRS